MEKTKTIIEPPSRLSLGLRELWQYRELFYYFTWRDIKVKYKQTYLGVLWVVLQPLGLMFLFTLVFKRFQSNAIEMRYEIFILSGITLWSFFSSSVSSAADSITSQANIIRKIYFPRLIIPYSSILTALFDFSIAFSLFLLFSFFYKEIPQLNALIYFPLAFILLFIATSGIALFVSALNVKYRDFRYVIPFLLQLFFFSSQILYSLEGFKHDSIRYILALNPLNGVIELFRIPYTTTYNFNIVLISLISSLAFLLVGLFLFRKTEAYFADIV